VQVAAEAREAVCIGVARSGELYEPPTRLQEWQIRYAGQHPEPQDDITAAARSSVEGRSDCAAD
jgi:hypothetical protein